MPQIFRIGSYIIYFWSNENNPLEPVHVHIAEGKATANATKVWITSSRKALLCNNASHIPQKMLNNMMRYIEANSSIIINKWYVHLGKLVIIADKFKTIGRRQTIKDQMTGENHKRFSPVWFK